METYLNTSRGLRVLLDEEDFNRFRSIRLFACPRHKSPGFYIKFRTLIQDRPVMEYLHRAILGLKRGDGRIADHINGNTLDCRKANLRIVTASQNSLNMPHQGATYDRRKQKRTTSVCVQGKRTWLGYFPTREEAETAYKQAAKEQFGEFYREAQVDV